LPSAALPDEGKLAEKGKLLPVMPVLPILLIMKTEDGKETTVDCTLSLVSPV
jgi:hypothetical protein